jgi:O-antigen ligase/Tfp pilus assembly protein PilF
VQFINTIKNNLSKYIHENIILAIIIYSVLAYGAVEFWAHTFLSLFLLVWTTILSFNSFKQSKIQLKFSLIDVFILMFLAFELLSLLYSVSFFVTKRSIFLNLNYFIIFYYTLKKIKRKEQILYLVHGIVLFGSIYAIVALSIIGLDFIGLRNFSSDDHITLTFVNRNHFSGFLEMVVFLGVALGLIHHQPKRSMFLFISAYMASAIFFSLSRGGILGFTTSLLFLSLLFLFFEKNRKNGLIIASFAGIVISIIVFLGIEPIIERLETLENPQLAGSGRLEYWTGSIAMIKDNFILGTGLGTFSTAYPKYQTAYANSMFVTHPHNDYLELFTETGLIGFILFSGIVVSFYLFVLKNYKKQKDVELKLIAISILASVFSIIIHSFTDFNFQVPSNVVLFGVIGALAINSIRNNITYKSFNLKLHIPPIVLKPAIISIGITLFIWISMSYVSDQFYRTALDLKIEKKYSEALQKLETASILERSNPYIYSEFGDIYKRLAHSTLDIDQKEENFNKSLSNFDIAINKLPVNSEFYTRKAFLLSDMELTEEAIQSSKSAIEWMPNKAQTRFNYARMLLRSNQLSESLEQFKITLDLSLEYLEATITNLINRGFSINEISTIIPNSVEARKKYANALTKLKSHEEAIDEFQKVYQLEPNDKNAIYFIYALNRAKMEDQAIIALDSFISLHPDSEALKSRIIYQFNRKKEYSKSIEYLNHFLETEPDSKTFHLELATAYNYLKETNNSDSIYRLLIKKHPADAQVNYSYGMHFYKLQDYDNALLYLKKANSLKSNQYIYHYHLGKVYETLKLYAQALEQYEKALQLRPNHHASKKAAENINLILGQNIN